MMSRRHKMAVSSKRSTIYLEPGIHRALVNDAVKVLLSEDAEDLEAFKKRAKEPLISFEEMLKDLKKRGQI
jgi:hypothetical protein